MRCTRCHRPLTTPPIMLGEPGAERGYGPVCALKLGGSAQLPLKPKRMRTCGIGRRGKRGDPRQASLLVGV